MLLLENSIYESRLGYPVYYQSHHGYLPLPSTPPYSHWDSLALGSYTKSEKGYSSSVTEPSISMVHPPLVYPQFPTPPLSVSPPAVLGADKPESFQIKRLLSLAQDYSSNADQTDKHFSMRTESVIMKIEDQRVFQVDSTTSTTTAITDDDTSFGPAYKHHGHHHHQLASGLESFAPVAPSPSCPQETPIFICKWEKCYKVFCHLNDLAGHVTQAHGSTPAGSINYYCKWEGCPRTDRGFNARYKMLVHIRTHTKEKPHHCPECDKCFSRAENLKIHIRSHSGEKPYACPVKGCNKAYSNSSDRFKHTRTHSMTKPYQCKVPGCNKRYTDPSSLRKHVKTYKHKQQDAEDLLMQERGITSTVEDVDDTIMRSEMFYKPVSSPAPTTASFVSIDQRMTDLDIKERAACYCSREKNSQENGLQDHLKMYRLGAIFNVSPSSCDVQVSSSSRLDSLSYLHRSRSGPEVEYNTDLDDSPLDLSLRTK